MVYFLSVSIILISIPPRQTHKCNIASITIGECNVTKSDCIRNVGILFGSTMQMKQQIEAVVKSYIKIETVGRIRKFMTTEFASNLIHAFISSKLEISEFLTIWPNRC